MFEKITIDEVNCDKKKSRLYEMQSKEMSPHCIINNRIYVFTKVLGLIQIVKKDLKLSS